MKNKIIRIALTGGPCGGKSSALTYLRQKLEDKGYIVLVVPESATLCISNGVSPIREVIGINTAQNAIMSLVLSFEDIWNNVAQKLVKDHNVVILCDRGVCDAKAYVQETLYETLLKDRGLHPTQVRDTRYDAVVHLKTAADGAEEFYTLVNNSARYETPEQARIQDEKIINAWIGHPHFRVIDNSTNFEEKIRRVYAEICQIIGIPVPIERERKFIVSFDKKDIPKNAQQVEIEQVYLISSDPNAVLRIRKRSQYGFSTYYRTIKLPSEKSGERIEIEDMITEREYLSGLKSRRLDTCSVVKRRTCFLFKNQYFELDEFEQPEIVGNNALLEIEISDLSTEVSFPDWINVEKEVTEDPQYFNFNIAQKLTKLP